MGPLFGQLPEHDRNRLSYILAKLDSNSTPQAVSSEESRYRVRPEAGEWLHSRIILFLLRDVFGCADLGRCEKVLFRCPLVFDGIPMMVVCSKLGLSVRVAENSVNGLADAEAAVRDLFRQLQKAMPIVEKHLLGPLIEKQMSSGNVTIDNRYSWFRDMYGYFRKKSERCVERAECRQYAEYDGNVNVFSDHIDRLNEKYNFRLKGSYFASAAVMAYFSALEHLLVIALALTDFDPSKESLARFIGDRWSDKFRRVADIGNDSDAKACYDKLHAIAENVRNPDAHGGFDHSQSRFHVHVPYIGAVPAQLSKAGNYAPFDLAIALKPIEDSHWVLLDGVDNWFQSGSLRFATALAESGLDIMFDTESRAELTAAAVDSKTFRSYLEALSYEADRAANMEW